MSKGSGDPQIRVAKISAFQAVIVALITAIAGIVAGYYARNPPITGNTLRQRWLYIEEIRAEKDLSHARVRLTASVNGVEFSFPTKALWADIGKHTGSFPLPLASEYNISFRAFVLMHSDPSENALVEGENQTVDKILESEIAANQRQYTYPLTLRNTPNMYSVAADLFVVYSVH